MKRSKNKRNAVIKRYGIGNEKNLNIRQSQCAYRIMLQLCRLLEAIKRHLVITKRVVTTKNLPISSSFLTIPVNITFTQQIPKGHFSIISGKSLFTFSYLGNQSSVGRFFFFFYVLCCFREKKRQNLLLVIYDMINLRKVYISLECLDFSCYLKMDYCSFQL